MYVWLCAFFGMRVMGYVYVPGLVYVWGLKKVSVQMELCAFANVRAPVCFHVVASLNVRALFLCLHARDL